MFAVGISPSDFYNFALVVLQAFQALREGDGSRERFQDTTRNIQSRIDVFQAADDFATPQGAVPFSNSVRDVVKGVLVQDRKAKAKLDKYNSTLGPQAPRERWRGVRAKLQWSCGGAQDQTERNDRSGPGVDATILGSILETTRRITEMESETQACIEESTVNILRQNEIVADKTSAFLADAENRHPAHLDCNKADILSEFDRTKKEDVTSLAKQLAQALQTTLHNQDAHSRAFEQKLETILNAPAVHCKSRERQLTKIWPDIRDDVVKGSILTISCVLYGHPSMKKAVRALVAQISRDPILALLVVFAGYFFTRHFSNVAIPLSIGGQHSLRSSDPFVTLLQTEFRKLRLKVSRPSYHFTGTIYILSMQYGEGVVRIGCTSRDVHRRMKDWLRRCAIELQLEYSLARIQNVRIAEYLLHHELRTSRTPQRCTKCKYRHMELFKIDVQVAAKVVSQVLDWT